MSKETLREKAKEILDIFEKDMSKMGWKTLYNINPFQPRVMCQKSGHYSVTAVAFIEPVMNTVHFSVSANVGTDCLSVMYFKIDDVFAPNFESRYFNLMKEAQSYFDKEIERKEDRRDF